MMWVSHETIYRSLFVQGRGELRRELTRCLRTGRAKRRPRSRGETRGRLPGMVMISERPAEVEDRAVPGHWEGDLLVGKSNRSAVGTLVERATRFVLLLHLPNGYGPAAVRDALITKIQSLPEHLRRSLTWDQGTDLSTHSAEHLNLIAAELNGRPRKTLGWDTPAERLATLLTTNKQQHCNNP